MSCSSITILRRLSSFLALLVVAQAFLSSRADADVCVWRDPEKTMVRIFPEARDYATVTKKMSSEDIARIEKTLGAPLEDSERQDFNFYEITGARKDGRPQQLGVIMAHAGKGEYGVIEVVAGVSAEGKAVGVYIQRSRERVTKALKDAGFLKQFLGKDGDASLVVGKDLKSTSPEAAQASQVVATATKKMLVIYQVLMKGESR